MTVLCASSFGRASFLSFTVSVTMSIIMSLAECATMSVNVSEAVTVMVN